MYVLPVTGQRQAEGEVEVEQQSERVQNMLEDLLEDLQVFFSSRSYPKERSNRKEGIWRAIAA